MQTIINTHLGQNRGKPRIWVEGKKLSVAFNIGDTYEIVYDKEARTVDVIADENGRFTVNKRTKRETVLPLIELRDDELSELYEYNMRLTLKVSKGRITCKVNAIDESNQKRAEEFKAKVLAGETLTAGTVFTGGGFIDRAIHEGLQMAGINSKLKLVIESESMYLESFLRNQSDLLADDAIVFNSKVEEIDLDDEDLTFTLDFLLATIPCTGASLAGRTSGKLATAEHHESAGAAFFYTLGLVKKFKVVSFVIENVKEYLNTASYAVITSVLKNWGYNVKERILNANEYGELENRDRLCMVANLAQLDEFEFDNVIPLKEKAESLNEFIEPIPLDDPSWRSFDYLKEKAIRDKAAKKGFGITLYDGSEEKVITIRRTYHKAGSCDPYLRHPTDPELSRLFTPSEHIAFKGIPLHLFDGNSNTIMHELAGQSGCFFKFVSVGVGLGVNYLMGSKRYTSLVMIDETINVDVFKKFGRHARVIQSTHNGKGFILLSTKATEYLAANGVVIENMAA
jgi:DNA (cytosine-5)-methyltransferase 1